MKSTGFRIVLLLFVTLGAFGVTKGQEPQFWYPVEPFRIEVDRQNPEVRALLERWDTIGNEARDSTNGFAGTFLKSGYRGWILRWAPHAGFIYVYHYEGLSIIDFSYGKVEVTSSEIRFIPERDMRETFRGIKLRTPLTWVAAQSPRSKYMVPKAEVKDFGQYVAGLSYYNDFNGPCCEFDPFFVWRATNAEPARSDEAVLIPDEYQRLMRQPITGRIVSVGKRRTVKYYRLQGKFYSHNFLEGASLTPIVIDAGRIQGLRKNMLLRITGSEFLPSQYIQVTSVSRQTATAVLIRNVDDRNNESYIDDNPASNQRLSYPPIHPGMRVTTSPILNN